MEFIRVEVRKIKDGELPPLILPKVSGHRRVYVHTDHGIHYLMNIMAVGDKADGITYGEADFQMSIHTPEKYFRPITPVFMRIAKERGVDQKVIAFLAIIDPSGPKLAKIVGPLPERDAILL